METSTQNSEQVIFKTSVFGGFEKQDVLSYIDKIREENENNVVNLNDSLQKMEDAGNQLRNQISGFEGKIAELEQQLCDKGSKIQELTGQIDNLRRKVSDSSSKRQELKDELETVKEENTFLQKRADSLKDKAVRYDEVKNQLGEIMISAREDADKVVKTADLKAFEITSRATEASNKVTSQMLGLKTEISEMKDNLVKLTEAFAQRLSEIDIAIDELMKSEENTSKNEEAFKEEQVEEPKLEKNSGNIKIPVTVGASGGFDSKNARRNAQNFFRRAAKNRRG